MKTHTTADTYFLVSLQNARNESFEYYSINIISDYFGTNRLHKNKQRLMIRIHIQF